ncbi:type II toxin-antitoxin system PemK/MazF family toxin [Lacticaseibacillus hulanensis]|uniref:type II toxin-antitoxin system PemK/MazF family toxin n=1 Tax=Lacticaseibacillus hulanensis TaxID=2493111 RepID=UPI001F4E2B64|nr:type II toxin-antitoxin system PemK/MazF family toxin [Lacticaseibacillus hulanensis]
MQKSAHLVPMRQGGIYWIQLNPVAGHEQSGKRPVLVVSANDFYRVTHMVKVMAISSKERVFPLRVDLPQGLSTVGQVLVDQERSIDPNAPEREAEFIEMVPKPFLMKIAKLNDATHEVR